MGKQESLLSNEATTHYTVDNGKKGNDPLREQEEEPIHRPAIGVREGRTKPQSIDHGSF